MMVLTNEICTLISKYAYLPVRAQTVVGNSDRLWGKEPDSRAQVQKGDLPFTFHPFKVQLTVEQWISTVQVHLHVDYFQ